MTYQYSPLLALIESASPTPRQRYEACVAVVAAVPVVATLGRYRLDLTTAGVATLVDHDDQVVGRVAVTDADRTAVAATNGEARS